MDLLCLTEHMPRDDKDLYPEEIAENLTAVDLAKIMDDYVIEAARLREKYAGQIKILIGVEIDWIRPESQMFVETLLSRHPLELFVGSVHHVHGVPIDYNQELYHKARTQLGGTDHKLFEAYFDDQFAMLQALKPPVVGHFDLIRLYSDDKEVDGGFQQWPVIWSKILRNLEFIAEYGGLVELNSAAIRKGMSEPYPKQEICEVRSGCSNPLARSRLATTSPVAVQASLLTVMQVFLKMGGRFTLSDDSHGVEQVGQNFHLVKQMIKRAGIAELFFLEKGPETKDQRFPNVSDRSITVEQLLHSQFWNQGT